MRLFTVRIARALEEEAYVEIQAHTEDEALKLAEHELNLGGDTLDWNFTGMVLDEVLEIEED